MLKYKMAAVCLNKVILASKEVITPILKKYLNHTKGILPLKSDYNNNRSYLSHYKSDLGH